MCVYFIYSIIPYRRAEVAFSFTIFFFILFRYLSTLGQEHPFNFQEVVNYVYIYGDCQRGV